MAKGRRTTLDAAARAALVADYLAGMGINALRTRYGCGQARVIAIVEAAAVPRRQRPAIGERKRGVPRHAIVARSAGLGRRPSAEEWGYLAGIFDGEGYLGFATRGRYYRLAITQRLDRGLLEWVQGRLGAGRIARLAPSSGMNMGQFHLEAQRAIFEFCVGVLPFLMVKGERVLAVLASFHEKYGWPVTTLRTDPHGSARRTASRNALPSLGRGSRVNANRPRDDGPTA